MSVVCRYKIIYLIEREYNSFIESLEGLNDSCFKMKINDEVKSPKDILIEQIELLKNCVAQREISREKNYQSYSFEELRYILNLMHINLMTWVENLSDDSMIMEECMEGNYASVIEWFDKFLIDDLKKHNIEMEVWRDYYKKYREDL